MSRLSGVSGSGVLLAEKMGSSFDPVANLTRIEF